MAEIDKPHFQVKTGKTLAQMRKLHERGEPILPVAKPTPIPPPPTPIRRVLLLKEPHLRGDDVRALQKAISKSGISILVDGDFGRATHAALQKFQVQKSLVADGIAGPKTRAALGI